ncbi:MAG: hypothetical protein ACI31S_06485 [Bacilli bacterium]
MERKNTGLKVLVVILTILVIALGGFIIYDKVLKEETIEPDILDDIDNKEIIYNYSDIKGLYTAHETVNIDGLEEAQNASYTLYLWENGTFKYEYGVFAPMGVIGNYTIVDDEIRLNYLFQTSSDVSLTPIEGDKVLKISSDSSILDSDYYFKENTNNVEEVKLVKANAEEESNYKYNIYNILSNYDYVHPSQTTD